MLLLQIGAKFAQIVGVVKLLEATCALRGWATTAVQSLELRAQGDRRVLQERAFESAGVGCPRQDAVSGGGQDPIERTLSFAVL